jgi:RES domain-containing protein
MDVEEVSIDAVWWRQIPGGGDVHYRPADPADSRWQHGAVIEALYFANSEETAWAEWYRFLAEAGLPPKMALPRDLWEWRIELDGIVDLSSEDRLAAVGLPMPEPGRIQWPPFQTLGERLHGAGHRGLLAPSAARPKEGRVLCLFREEERIDGTEPLPPPKTFAEPPQVPRGMTT